MQVSLHFKELLVEMPSINEAVEDFLSRRAIAVEYRMENKAFGLFHYSWPANRNCGSHDAPKHTVKSSRFSFVHREESDAHGYVQNESGRLGRPTEEALAGRLIVLRTKCCDQGFHYIPH